MSSKRRGFDRRKLNPAFTAAHGLPEQQSAFRDTALSAEDAAASSGTKDGAAGNSTSSSRPPPGKKRIEHALKAARSTGRLNLSDCGLTAPLPDVIFDLRSGITVDYSMDRDREHDLASPWDTKGEEELTLVDFSDNDLSLSSSPPSTTTKPSSARPSARVGGFGGRGDERGGEDESNKGGGELDRRIECFAAVRTLRCRRCRIRSVPWTAIGTLDHLTLLDLSGNELASVPLHFLPIGLRELDLSSNKIVSLSRYEVVASRDQSGGANDSAKEDQEPEIILPHLTRLDLTENKIEELPETIRLGSLQTLRFGKNRIATLPESLIAQCSKSLSTLEGPENRMSESPCLSDCRALRVVDLSDNQLQDVPTVHESLVRLALPNNKITTITSMFGDGVEGGGSEPFRSQLSEFRLRQNKLETLDEDVLSSLTSLTLLDLGENELRDLPSVIGYLQQLRRVPLDRNPLKRIRLSVAEDTEALKKLLRKRGPPPPGPGYAQAEGGQGDDSGSVSEVNRTEAKSVVNNSMTGSHTLDLSNKELSGISAPIITELLSSAAGASSEESPSTVGGHVRSLKLSHNKLAAISEELISALPNIQRLDAGHNQIESLPANLADVPLTSVELNRNWLMSDALASSFCRGIEASRLAQHLTHLNLSANGIDWIPRGLFDLPRLSTLILSHNRIQSLSRSNGGNSGWCPGLPSLENLDLSDNQISDLGDLPTVLSGCCTKLRSLMLSNNELKSIPPTLGLVRTLQSIDLRGNPQRSIRTAVLDRSCGAILSYLRSRLGVDEMQDATKMQEEFSKQVKQAVDVAKEEEGMGSGSVIESTCSKPTMSRVNSSGAKADTSPLAEELRDEVSKLTKQLNNVYLTEAKKYAMKKTLAMTKAKLIREERRLKALRT
uniref:Uncharacterized protein n=1 Tax=Odontella aurita TaxID=265563 RepID=A0A7S4IZQ0_9STRA|mmetsp:Transcript_34205/g.102351  ORF Transcript_34205/g.102351 Transcript_34205/m.102351 type:complete len:895 (+) Transcript_34205:460-3144(+)|eukprot:CAMPEP_0113590388 /NCGR_PEP_ID=MMETSP0015_2-20120614/36655_1 /TAXON_ID=2838 /ORGANISM="Odontella" /LENGTH=894 /DNA_ID=CAMNT_0000496591 /DNA_START=384 /DNA_END=3071 /DNA_ORIENTATION=- /assembly_acc=CAM_ASM_000160